MCVLVYEPPLTIAQVLSALEEQPKTIASLTKGIAPGRLGDTPAPDEWSVNDVLAHLRSCADVWGGYITRIVNEDHPAYRAVNPRTWVKRTNYPELDFAVSFRAYRTQRAQLVGFLHALPKSAWSRSATVTGAGSPRERTVLDYARWLANHERSHLKQIARMGAVPNPELE